MIFGIDFGTTNTVVAWVNKDGCIQFLEWPEYGALLPTKTCGIENVKRKLAQDSSLFKQSEFFLVVSDFFKSLYKALLGSDVKNCVLTVPARFDDLARNSIRACAMSAGFNVLKIITEPVAAAQMNLQDNGYYLVFDLGGGTFDATVLKFHEGVCQILAIDGLKNFGGIDIDAIVANYASTDLMIAEQIKNDGAFDEVLTSQINKALLPTYNIIHSLAQQLDIKKLFLVGGASKLPMIAQYFKQFYDVKTNEVPELLVATGAAMHGYAIANNSDFLIDVTPFHLGIEVANDGFEILIPKNSPIPFYAQQFFAPANNSRIVLNIYQGVSEILAECVLLKQFTIPNSNKPFKLTFALDCDGIFSLKVDDDVMEVVSIF